MAQARPSYGLPSEFKCAVYKLRRKLENEFYRAPTPLHSWDDEQASHETAWADLFFDLVVVGVVFRLGDLLVGELEQADRVSSPFVGRGLIWMAILFLFVLDNWGQHVHLRSVFSMSSLYHRSLDIVEACAVALMAVHIVPVDRFIASQEDDSIYNYMLAVTAIKIAFLAIAFSVFGEVAVWSDDPVARAMGARNCREIALFSAPVWVASVTSALRVDWRVTLALWGLHPVLVRGALLWRAIFVRKNYRRSSLPIHVSHVMRRYAEFTMVMLGEGVLQIIITPLDEAYAAAHLGTFAMSFAILALLMLTHYRLMPSEPADHAARKSRIRGVLNVQFVAVYNLAFVITGVGLKSNLKYQKKTDKERYQVFTWALCLGLAVSAIGMTLSKLMHVGPAEILLNTPKRVLKKRILFIVLRLVTPLAFLALPGLALKGVANAAAALVLTLALSLTVIADGRTADDARPAEFDEDLQEQTVDKLAQDVMQLARRSRVVVAPNEVFDQHGYEIEAPSDQGKGAF